MSAAEVRIQCKILALAGRRVDPLGADQARFPFSAVSEVSSRLHQTFRQLGTVGLVSSAACGADLLALEVAGQLSIRRKVILPFAPDLFRTTSVIDRPGQWGRLFDRIIAEVKREDGLIVLNAGDGAEAYSAANRAILDEACRWDVVAPDTACAVVVWEGTSRGEDDATAEFAQLARERRLPVHEVLTVP